MDNLKIDELEIKLENGAKPVMRWLGISNTRNPSAAINPFVDDLLNNISAQEIDIDLRQLEYMNSSTVKAIIHLVKELGKKNIQATIIYNKVSNSSPDHTTTFD